MKMPPFPRWARVFVALCVVFGAEHQALGEERFQPGDTYAVIAGVLQWSDSSFTSYPDTNRKDRELYDTLRERGVPAEHMRLLLDADATGAAIRDAIRTVAAGAPPGATFIFYYAGHGLKQPDGRVFFANYDISGESPETTGFSVDEVAALLRERFKGRRVMLLADCCYSGGLARAAAALGRAGFESVSLTSASSSNASTGNWTFTQTVIDSLRGDAIADRDGDGAVTLAELAAEVADAMRFRERQRSGFADEGFPEDLRLAPAVRSARLEGLGPGAWPYRTYLLGRDGSEWLPARVLGGRGGATLVEFYRYSERSRTFLAADRLKPIEGKEYPVDARVEVTWGDRTWEARILKVEDGFHLITYPGWSAEWDEWVMSDRIVGLFGGQPEGRRPVVVEWHGAWWPAELLRTEGDLSCVHYVGYDSSWDECVPPSRIRLAAERRRETN